MQDGFSSDRLCNILNYTCDHIPCLSNEYGNTYTINSRIVPEIFVPTPECATELVMRYICIYAIKHSNF